MKENRNWLDRLSQGLDLPGETPPGQPIVEIAGERRVLIEHHNGIVQYGRELICVKVKYGFVRICGRGLELANMTCNQLVILGHIDSVTLYRRS